MSRRVAILFLFTLLFSACAPASVQTPNALATMDASPTATEVTVASEVTVTLTASPAFEPATPDSFACYDQTKIKEMCLGLKPVDQKAQMEFVYENFFTSPSNAQYFQELLGLPKGTVVTAEQVRAWGEENGMKFPAISPAGTPLVFLQAASNNPSGQLVARFKPNEQVDKLGQVNFSHGLRLIVFDNNTWRADAGDVQTEVRRLMNLNGNSWLIFSNGNPSSAAETFGLLFDENGEPVMVMGSTMITDFTIQQKTDKFLFGGRGADPASLGSAYFEGYWRTYGEYDNDKLDPKKNDVGQVDFSLNPEARDVLRSPLDFSGDDSWFALVQ